MVINLDVPYEIFISTEFWLQGEMALGLQDWPSKAADGGGYGVVI
jgi:hypothetical protein